MLQAAYNRLPSTLQPTARQVYDWLFLPDESVYDEFITQFFPSNTKFQRYVEEFNEQGARSRIEQAVDEFNKEVTDSRGSWAGMGLEPAQALYSLIRHEEPSVVVETGVCNGVSSLVILLALQKNEGGMLYSIDYPMYSDDPLPQFRKNAYPEGHAFSAIPTDKEPGWIVPDDLRNKWELRLGKSQRKLPGLVCDIDNIDIFLHDSEHTLPCMMFEFEIAWEWMTDKGILLADDVNRNNAFNQFTAIRAPDTAGYMTSTVGFATRK